MRTTRHGTQNAVQSMFIILGHRHRLLQVRALLPKKTEENNKFVQYLMDLLSIPNCYIKKGRHGHRYGKKPWDRDYYITNSLKKKCKKKYYLGIHVRFIRGKKFRKNMFDTGRTEEMCRKMDELANEDHTHHLTPEEIRDYRVNWWIRSDKVGSGTMPVRHRPDFKQALSTLRQLKTKKMKLNASKMDAKLFLVLVELARILVAFL